MSVNWLQVWRYGPPLGTVVYAGGLVEEPKGGVILIGGLSTGTVFLNTIFRLRNTNSVWEPIGRTLQSARYKPVAFLVPDILTNCTRLWFFIVSTIRPLNLINLGQTKILRMITITEYLIVFVPYSLTRYDFIGCSSNEIEREYLYAVHYFGIKTIEK